MLLFGCDAPSAHAAVREQQKTLADWAITRAISLNVNFVIFRCANGRQVCDSTIQLTPVTFHTRSVFYPIKTHLFFYSYITLDSHPINDAHPEAGTASYIQQVHCDSLLLALSLHPIPI